MCSRLAFQALGFSIPGSSIAVVVTYVPITKSLFCNGELLFMSLIQLQVTSPDPNLVEEIFEFICHPPSTRQFKTQDYGALSMTLLLPMITQVGWWSSVS